ncbi:MAG: hypothetical protein ACTSWN_00220 [Promethearchaeota archaeon]
MSELLLLKDIFKVVNNNKKINLIKLFEKIERPELSSYLGDVESLKLLFFRLNQQGIMKLRFKDDYIIVEGIDFDSALHSKIQKLLDVFESCKDYEGFKNRIITSELNQYFLNEEEIKAVFTCLSNE